ncbi:substrate-binding domain-containing protein [Ponticoccus litoralis]|uniref:Substrate-binding domain-containing protein n=1 Tax=Ponticoccus litoralis TaxID=422297 RepID=A0AAW9SQ89_9RHOB
MFAAGDADADPQQGWDKGACRQLRHQRPFQRRAHGRRRTGRAGGAKDRLRLGPGGNDPDASAERLRGFLAGLEQAGVVAMAAYDGDHTYDAGRRAAREFCTARTRPDGVFCGNDLMAMGFKDTAEEEFGLTAPSNYQLVGYDNIETAGYRPYRLSTVAQDMAAVIAAAVRGINELVEKPEKSIRVTVPVEFIARTTTTERVPE